MNENLNVIIDLSVYKPKFGDRVAEGTYLVVVTDAEAGETKKGDPKITLWYDIVDGPEAGSVLVDTLTLTSNAIFRTVNFMRAIGLPTPKKKLPINLRSWIGKRLEVSVADGDPFGDNNEIRSEVKSYARARPTTPVTTTTDDPWAVEEPATYIAPKEGLDEFAEKTTANSDFGTPDSVPVAHTTPAVVQDTVSVSSDDDHPSEQNARDALKPDTNQQTIEDSHDFGSSETINLDDIEGL